MGYHLKKMQKDEDVYKDRESQIAAIEKTFEDAKVPIEKHFNKPGVYAVEVIRDGRGIDLQYMFFFYH